MFLRYLQLYSSVLTPVLILTCDIPYQLNTTKNIIIYSGQKMDSPPSISRKPLTNLYRPMRNLACARQGVCNAGIALVSRYPDGYICLEKKLPPALIKSGAAIFEFSTLRRLRHVNIVKYLDAYIGTEQGLHLASASLYMEYCSWGSLADEIARRVQYGRWFEEREIVDILSQLVNALAYLQTGLSDAINHPEEQRNRNWVGVVHRDLKSENIFLRSNPNPNGSGRPIAVIGDFGAAALEEGPGGKIGKGIAIPNKWASPEWPTFSFASDVWLLGSLVQECCRLNRTMVEERIAVLGLGNRYSRHLQEAVAMFMHPDPEKRPQIHRWAPILRTYAYMARGGNERFHIRN